ncbi:MAG: hypothetical protein L3J01_00780 [Thiomicrorhabdus sp.]|nr:hypothetical protein [Thiomicrorhabdus sp.]
MKRFITIASLLLATQVVASEKVTLDYPILSIPSIEVNGEMGVYQDVVFKHSRRGGWKVIGFQRSRPVQQIAEAELIQTQGFPVQIFLKISGIFNNSCQTLGRIEHKLTENSFDVSAFYSVDSQDPDRYCLMVMVPFTKIIPLPVYGLSAGTYHYAINGNFAGSFSLAKDNFFLEKPSYSVLITAESE